MIFWIVLVILIIAGTLILVWSLCQISGECSRAEERRIAAEKKWVARLYANKYGQREDSE